MKRVLIYGGSSLISIELIKILYQEIDKFVVFCRNKDLFSKKMADLEFDNNKFDTREVDLENLKENLEMADTIDNLKF